MSTYKFELVGNPNSCIAKLNKQKFCVVLTPFAETKGYHIFI